LLSGRVQGGFATPVELPRKHTHPTPPRWTQGVSAR